MEMCRKLQRVYGDLQQTIQKLGEFPIGQITHPQGVHPYIMEEPIVTNWEN